MLTDWTLIRRLAHELEARLRGARALDAGLLHDGRVAISLRSRGETLLLVFDPFASPPLVTLERGQLDTFTETRFARTLGVALRDMTLQAVDARRGDRLLRLRWGARSRFGVETQLELYAELVPRFGNLVLVKNDRIVAALKEFSPAEHPSRPIAAGLTYALPTPLAGDRLVPKIAIDAGVDTRAFLALAESEAALNQPLYVYRDDGGQLLQAHLIPLSHDVRARCTREPLLLDLFAELRDAETKRSQHTGTQRRREAASRRLRQRAAKLHGELDGLAAKRAQIDGRDRLRHEGEEIFAALHELSGEPREEAKERAAALFARYKKLGAALAHVEQRERVVRASIDQCEALQWEVERAADDDLGDVEAAIASLERHGSGVQAAPSRRKRRTPLEYRTRSGSRIMVGRSPSENAELTFRVARAYDLWFHAQRVPGAHVVLLRDDRSAAPPEDVAAAAALAALHSKARASGAVTVDYTARRNVRKQRNAPPGLVWYTQPTTVIARPDEALSLTPFRA
jgi:predicted ribosome quality control (RQC) complex YloA/Tae2 family protein